MWVTIVVIVVAIVVVIATTIKDGQFEFQVDPLGKSSIK